MRAVVRWVEGALFLGETGSGHAVAMDGPPEGGGRNLGPRPMEMLLLGLGACTAYDVVAILRKARQPVAGCRVEVEAERAPRPPKVFTRIHLRYLVAGEGLREGAVERAVRLSAEKYCSASLMLGATAAISHEWVLVPPGPAPGEAGEGG